MIITKSIWYQLYNDIKIIWLTSHNFRKFTFLRNDILNVWSWIDHGDDINPGIDPESETQNESEISESNNKTTETESERFEHLHIIIPWDISFKMV
jgi:hypothetical protein